MDVSVIIVNMDTKDLLRDCLKSVFGDFGPLQVEVIVVDNASTDGSVEMVRDEFPKVRLKVNTKNEGYAKPNNDGMRMAEGRYLFLLNSDTILQPGALQSLVSVLQEHRDVGACGPLLVYGDGRIQHSVKGFPTLWTHACDMFFLDRLFPRTRLFGRGEMAYFDYTTKGEVDHVMAAAFLVRRPVLETVGMFDERFSIYYNDMDWCYRIKQRGWKIWYVPESKVIHYHGQTVARVNREFSYFQEMYDNVMLFYLKHYGYTSVVVYKLILLLGFSLRVAGWWLVRMVRQSERADYMFRFSWKTVGVALQFWKVASYSTLK